MHLTNKGKRKVGIDAALMKLVEDNDAYTVKRRVADHHTRENAFRQYLNLSVGRDTVLKSYTIADCSADILFQYVRHA